MNIFEWPNRIHCHDRIWQYSEACVSAKMLIHQIHFWSVLFFCCNTYNQGCLFLSTKVFQLIFSVSFFSFRSSFPRPKSSNIFAIGKFGRQNEATRGSASSEPELGESRIEHFTRRSAQVDRTRFRSDSETRFKTKFKGDKLAKYLYF